MAEQILQNALRIGLYIELDDITTGDGNCFYHAIIQQLRRPEIRRQLALDLTNTNHKMLRESICGFINDSESSTKYIQECRLYYETVLSAEYRNMSWDNHIAQQSRVGT